MCEEKMLECSLKKGAHRQLGHITLKNPLLFGVNLVQVCIPIDIPKSNWHQRDVDFRMGFVAHVFAINKTKKKKS